MNAATAIRFLQSVVIQAVELQRLITEREADRGKAIDLLEDVERDLEKVRLELETPKRFYRTWDPARYEGTPMDEVGSEAFGAATGYTPADVAAVESLDVGQKVTLDPGHEVWRLA